MRFPSAWKDLKAYVYCSLDCARSCYQWNPSALVEESAQAREARKKKVRSRPSCLSLTLIVIVKTESAEETRKAAGAGRRRRTTHPWHPSLLHHPAPNSSSYSDSCPRPTLSNASPKVRHHTPPIVRRSSTAYRPGIRRSRPLKTAIHHSQAWVGGSQTGVVGATTWIGCWWRWRCST